MTTTTTKQKKFYKGEVQKNGRFEICEKIDCIKGDAVLRSTLKRRQRTPLDDYSKENDDVKAICDKLFTQEVKDIYTASLSETKEAIEGIFLKQVLIDEQKLITVEYEEVSIVDNEVIRSTGEEKIALLDDVSEKHIIVRNIAEAFYTQERKDAYRNELAEKAEQELASQEEIARLQARPSEYHKWDSELLEWVADTGRKQEVVKRVKKKINTERDSATSNSIEYNGYLIKLSGDSKFDLLYLYTKAKELKANGIEHSFKWRASKIDKTGQPTIDKVIQLSVDDALDLLNVIAEKRTTAVFSFGDQKDKLQSKTTEELIEML